jgi:hypothetical protein
MPLVVIVASSCTFQEMRIEDTVASSPISSNVRIG